MAKTVALLDVDHTLLFDNSQVPNPALIAALRQYQIRDVFLFTDMTMGHSTVTGRMTLIDTLKAEGFEVHGVVTPCDYVWHVDEATLSEFDRILRDRNIDLRRKQNLGALEEALATVALVQEHQLSVGSAFTQAQNETADVIEGQSLACYEKSMHCKSFVSALSTQRQLTHDKALMFEQFLRHNNGVIENNDRIVVFDDKIRCLQGVKEIESAHIVDVVHIEKNDTKQSIEKKISANDIARALNRAATRYLTWAYENAYGTFFAKMRKPKDERHLRHGRRGRMRAARIQAFTQQIPCADFDALVQLLITTLKDSGACEHSLSRYVLAEMGEGDAVFTHQNKDVRNFKNSYSLQRFEDRQTYDESVIEMRTYSR